MKIMLIPYKYNVDPIYKYNANPIYVDDADPTLIPYMKTLSILYT